MRRLLAALAVLGGGVAAQAVAVPTVSAHATLESSNPVDGAMMTSAPDHVELVFSETVGQPAELVVLGPDGDEVEGGELRVIDDTMTRTYDPASFAPGSYTVSYQVTSADGHPIAGTLSFMVHGDGAAPVTIPSISTSDPTDADPVVVVILVLVLAAGLGIALVATRKLVTRDAEPS